MIKYCRGYKYQIVEDTYIQTRIYPAENLICPWAELNQSGELLIKKGFASDGPSGISIDTDTFMQGAFIHDALYYLIRQHKLGPIFRKYADKELYRVILEDGMNPLRAGYVYLAVRLFGKKAAKDKKRVFTAP